MNNLQKYRKEKNLTQATLSEISGVNFRTIQHYELLTNAELASAKASTILKFCNVLGCSVGALLASEDARTYDESH